MGELTTADLAERFHAARALGLDLGSLGNDYVAALEAERDALAAALDAAIEECEELTELIGDCCQKVGNDEKLARLRAVLADPGGPKGDD